MGTTNKNTLDPTEDFFFVLGANHPYGDHFEILGVNLDTKFSMYTEVSRVASEGSRRLQI